MNDYFFMELNFEIKENPIVTEKFYWFGIELIMYIPKLKFLITGPISNKKYSADYYKISKFLLTNQQIYDLFFTTESPECPICCEEEHEY